MDTNFTSHDYIDADPLPEDAYIEATLIDSNMPLTKTYAIHADGVPRVVGSPFLSIGTATRLRFPAEDFASEFSATLKVLHPGSCIVLGALSDSLTGNCADITTKDHYDPSSSGSGSPLIWRGKDWLGYKAGEPCILGLDHDAKDLPGNLRTRLISAGGLLSVLSSVCPALANSAIISRPSVSSGIVVTETGATSAGGGCHVYMPILDGGDAKNFVGLLHDRRILAGWGFPFVSEAGSLQVRSLVDTAASGVGERLWFEAPALLRHGLAHVPGARDVDVTTGSLLNTATALSPLSATETDRLSSIKSEFHSSVASEVAGKRERHSERVRADLIRRGYDEANIDDVVARLQDADGRSVLNGRHILHLDDGRVVSVMEVLTNRIDYHKATCADPLEPNYGGGTNKAVLYTDGHHAKLFSHAHGGRLFTLALDEVDLVTAFNAVRNTMEDGSTVLRKLAKDTVFAAGGWLQIEAATGVVAASEFGFGEEYRPTRNLTIPSIAIDAIKPVVGQETLLSIAPYSAPLDPDPVIDLLIRDFNNRFAVVAEGSSVGIVRLAYNAELDLRSPTIMTPDAFRLLYGNRYVSVAKNSRSGEDEFQQVLATSVWLKHLSRRTCPDGFGLDPTGTLPATCFNLWQGFGVEEKEGDWSKLASMIFEVLAGGNEVHFTYIIHWLAHLVQRPHESPGVALVFRGEEGVGKGTLGRALMRLMRPHAMQITHTKHLTGPFNAHMRSVLFLFADEAFFAGDKANEGALKGLVTEEFRVNEAKGRDATLGRNRIHLMMASNNDWVVPASAGARRYAVFDVSSVHKQDLNYFGPILEEMDVNGQAAGIAAMAYDLRRIPLDIDLIRKAPETVGLHAQRISSLRGTARWLLDVLVRGYAGQWSTDPWRDSYTTDELYDSYRAWAKDNNDPYPSDRHALGKFLSAMFDTVRPRVILDDGSKTRPPSYRLGALENARAVFAEKQGIGSPWPVENGFAAEVQGIT